MDNNIILTPVPIAELINQLRQVIKEEVSAENKKQLDEKLLSPIEACKLFVPAITRPTLDKMCTKGELKKYHFGSRVLFKQSEIFEALKSYKKYAR